MPADSPILTRRRLLQAAGGITFLALIPNGRGAFSAIFDRMAGHGAVPNPLPSLYRLTLPSARPKWRSADRQATSPSFSRGRPISVRRTSS